MRNWFRNLCKALPAAGFGVKQQILYNSYPFHQNHEGRLEL
jgi:hypothetical protein